jgi:hypothetical protein
MGKENNIQNHCSKCNHKWTTTDENLALWVTMHFWCDKCKASEILEWAKDDMFAKHFFDKDKQSWEDTMEITSTKDILRFINFVLDNH